MAALFCLEHTFEAAQPRITVGSARLDILSLGGDCTLKLVEACLAHRRDLLFAAIVKDQLNALSVELEEVIFVHGSRYR